MLKNIILLLIAYVISRVLFLHLTANFQAPYIKIRWNSSFLP